MPKYRMEHDEDFGKRKPLRKRGWFRLRNIFLFSVLVVIAGIGIGVPTLLSNRSFVVGVINRTAGLEPIKVDMSSISVGWFSPVKITGLRLLDLSAVSLVSVGEIEIDRGLLQLVRGYQDLGIVKVRNAEMQLTVQPGTTTLEEALKPLLAGASVQPATSSEAGPNSAAFPVRGRIKIENAIATAKDSIDGSVWQLTIRECDVPLPTAEQPVPPVNLVGTIQQLAGQSFSGLPAQGLFTIQTAPIPGVASTTSSIPAMKMTIATTELPLQWYSLVHRRFNDLPIERLEGTATVQTSIELLSPVDIQANIATAQLERISLVAPSLVGREGAKLEQIQLSGLLKLKPDRLIAENTLLKSDVGNLGIAASIPSTFALPSMTSPWIDNAQWDIQGNLDLAILARVAPGLISLQKNTQLTRGIAQLQSQQRLDKGQPISSHRIELGDLVGSVGGTPMTWEDALNASVNIERSANGVAAFDVQCSAEFCSLEGKGTLDGGSIASKVDLDRLHQRLSKWFAIPVSQLSGNADFELTWKKSAPNRLTANGSLNTTPLRIGLSQGRLNEPAWNGKFEAVATLDGTKLLQIDRGNLSLESESEILRVELQEPLSWTTSAPGAAPLPPAGVVLNLAGDMKGWQRRAQIVAGFDLGMEVDGKCELQALGAVDPRHAELSRISFVAQPFQVQSDGFAFREARVEADFNGRFDTNDVARLQVDKLDVRAESFAISAKDSAMGNSGVREGRAAFRIDPNRMMASMQSSPSDNTSPAMSIEGDFTGSASWVLDPQKDIRWQAVVDAKDVRVLQPSVNEAPGQPGQLVSTRSDRTKMSLLWEEPIAKGNLQGSYTFGNGALDFPELTLQTTWMAFGGSTKIDSKEDESIVRTQGKVTYDAAAVAERMKPWTGEYLKVAGQRTEPVEITWRTSPTISWTEALQAKMQLGWDSANVVGIDIGKADVPLTIVDGKFASKTTIPVSQGSLRWDLQSDLSRTPLAIQQSPEMVLENVAITPQMCQGWLKYVAPLVADVTSVQGNLSLAIERAEIVPADSLRQTIAGEIQVNNVTVGPGPLADQLIAIVQQVRSLRSAGGAAASPSNSAWLQMPEQKIQFAMEQGRVVHRNLKIQAGDIAITTEGSVAIDGQLALKASIPILKDWVDGTPALASLAGQNIEIPIGGTIQKPQVDFQAFTSIGQQMANAAAQGLLQKQIDKGLNKILGPLESKLGPLQQNLQQSLPQLPALPGGFQIPGFGAPAAPPAAPPQP